MKKLICAIYAVVFSLLTNCFLLTDRVFLRVSCIVIFVALNLICGFWAADCKSIRLRVLFHGTTLLICFCAAVAAAVALHGLRYLQCRSFEDKTLLHSAIYSAVCCLALFWNGILCVYLTSVQLGIKTRVMGLLCGWIPLANLVMLGIIIAKTGGEFTFERRKEKLNEERKARKICQTKYPILLVHGVFFRDSRVLNYWGRIPKELEKNGATCFYGKHQSAASVENSAKELTERIRKLLRETGCEKVNIIAHSKGGLDCRYAIAHCGIADAVASVTTVNTPHRGCLFAEWLLRKASQKLKSRVADAYNYAAVMLGDEKPDFIAAVSDLRADVCMAFDRETKCPDSIYCQSFGSVMKRATAGQFPLNFSYHLVKHFDGKNDGLVGVDSFAWGSSCTVLELPVRRGISHADMVDLNRTNIKGFDVREFYVQLVSQLREKGL